MPIREDIISATAEWNKQQMSKYPDVEEIMAGNDRTGVVSWRGKLIHDMSPAEVTDAFKGCAKALCGTYERLYDTERANAQMLAEIKNLNEDKAVMRKVVRDRYYQIKTDMNFKWAGCREVFLDELAAISGRFEEETAHNRDQNNG